MPYGWLQILMPDGQRRNFSLDKPSITIGRSPENDLSIEHLTISRHHARFTVEGQTFLLEDLGSANGTQIGAVPLPPNAPHRAAALQPFQLGDIRLQYVSPSSGTFTDVNTMPVQRTVPPPHSTAPAASSAPTEPTGSTWLELSKIIIPVIGTIIAACLSGVVLLLTSPGLVDRIFKPAEPAPATATPMVLLFQDDFSDPQSGWGAYRDADGSGAYQDGSYVFDVINGDFMFWANPDKNFRDVRLEVDAIQQAGPDTGFVGVMCRYQDSDNYYHFAISLDGQYQIRKRKNGEYDILNRGKAEDDKLIRGLGQTNHLRVDCIGSTLTLYVNGEKLGEVQDTTYVTGDVGISASRENGLKVLFDHLKVFQP